MHLSPPSGLGCCAFWGVGSVIVDLMFYVTPIVCGGSVLVFLLVCITLKLCDEEKAGCFAGCWLLCFNCLTDVLLQLIFCGSSSWYLGLVWVWLWYFLIMLTYYLNILNERNCGFTRLCLSQMINITRLCHWNAIHHQDVKPHQEYSLYKDHKFD